MQSNSPPELELGDYLAVFRRRRIWILIPLVALPWAAFFYSTTQPDRFVATARVLLGDTAAEEAVGNGSQSTSFRDRLLENEIRLATGDEAVAEVARRFAVTAVEAPTVEVTAETEADILEFRATADNPESAANIANAWAESYLTLKAEQTTGSFETAIQQFEAKLMELQEARAEVRSDVLRLEDQLASATDATRSRAQLRVDREASRISGEVTLIDAQIAATAGSITQLGLSGDLALGSGPRIVRAATPPISSSNATVGRNLVLGLVVGAIIGAALALLRENLDRAIRSSDDLAEFDLVHLGSIPKASRSERGELALAALQSPQSAQAAAYQKVRSALDFMAADHDLGSVAITSALQNEGKTTTAANLATAMAQSDTRTILIDCDLRRPRVHKVFRIAQSPGITSVVLDRSTLEASAWPIPSLADSFVVVPAGKLPPHPSSFISTPAFADAARELSAMADFTVFDAPPVLPVADTLTLAKHVDGVVMVIKAGQTKREQLAAALESLQNAGAKVIGAVIVGVRVEAGKYEYRYENEDQIDWLTPEEAARSRRPRRLPMVIDLRDRPADATEETVPR